MNNMIMTEFVIRKGAHYSKHFPKLNCNAQDDFQFIVKFDESCKYDLKDEDQLDINKLFGTSFGFNHHKNSFRIGWAYNIKTNKIELYNYWYENSIRFSSLITSVPINLKTIVSVKFHPKDINNYTLGDLGGYIETSVSAIGINPIKTTVPYDLENVPQYGLVLFPYFGGNKTAPHNIKIFLQVK